MTPSARRLCTQWFKPCSSARHTPHVPSVRNRWDDSIAESVHKQTSDIPWLLWSHLNETRSVLPPEGVGCCIQSWRCSPTMPDSGHKESSSNDLRSMWRSIKYNVLWTHYYLMRQTSNTISRVMPSLHPLCPVTQYLPGPENCFM